MSDDASLARAKQLEENGDFGAAAEAYAAMGRGMDAARLFVMVARPMDAGRALLFGIDRVDASLDLEKTERARLAAGFFREAGDAGLALRVLAALEGQADALEVSAALNQPPPEPAKPASRRPLTTRALVSEPPGTPRASVAPHTSASVAPPTRTSVAAGPRTSVAPDASASVAPPTRTSVAPSTASIAPSTGSPRSSAPSAPSAAPPTSGAPSAAPPTSGAPSAAPPTSGAPSSAPPTSGAPPARASSSSLPPERSTHGREAGWRDDDGATEETIRQFVESGRLGAAARVAWEAGQHARALPWFQELGLKYQAGACLRALGRPAEALETMLELPAGDTRYRRTAIEVVGLAREVGRLDFEVDHFFGAFVAEGPQSEEEVDVYLALAELYTEKGFERGGQRCAEAILAKYPGQTRARALLEASPPRHRSDRPRSQAPAARPLRGELTPVPSLEEFVRLAREHVPAKPKA